MSGLHAFYPAGYEARNALFFNLVYYTNRYCPNFRRCPQLTIVGGKGKVEKYWLWNFRMHEQAGTATESKHRYKRAEEGWNVLVPSEWAEMDPDLRLVVFVVVFNRNLKFRLSMKDLSGLIGRSYQVVRSISKELSQVHFSVFFHPHPSS